MGSNKRVTDPFNEKVRARIFGLSSGSSSISSSSSNSGSEHEGEYDIVSPSSMPCLSYLVQNFLEDDTSTNPQLPTQDNDDSDSDSDSDSGSYLESDSTRLINNIINPTLYNNNADQIRNQILNKVSLAVQIFSIFRKTNKSIFNRNVMSYLREIGYNAGVCKTKWKSNGNLKGGSYEFLDVIINNTDNNSTPNIRYIIDTEFSKEFEIARESECYKKVRESLPRILVSKPEDIKKIVKLMCDESRKSIKLNGLSLAPWRKYRFMQFKWFGPYRRSINHFSPVQPVGLPVVGRGFPVQCRAVGFDVPLDSDRFLFPSITRTR